MTDRELLELAAKAAGLKHAEYYRYDPSNGFPIVECITHYIDGEPCVQNWNPLTDDGDALRLAVKLKLLIDIRDKKVVAMNNMYKGSALDDDDQDLFAATRIAIVRAAAEIGRMG